jgi:hypothetical protein
VPAAAVMPVATAVVPVGRVAPALLELWVGAGGGPMPPTVEDEVAWTSGVVCVEDALDGAAADGAAADGGGSANSRQHVNAACHMGSSATDSMKAPSSSRIVCQVSGTRGRFHAAAMLSGPQSLVASVA